ncbi:hypothetical protein L917_02129 [Phytophthora nicotianae]|uniref:Uncharacterized protein n=1 Tax=Phytophthora nicotianae TaxID=4792 RepID=W2LXD4_PHYNI|nr:hypothetical protein L917_02129 [Phytophthora nicotianae]
MASIESDDSLSDLIDGDFRAGGDAEDASLHMSGEGPLLLAQSTSSDAQEQQGVTVSEDGDEDRAESSPELKKTVGARQHRACGSQPGHKDERLDHPVSQRSGILAHVFSCARCKHFAAHQPQLVCRYPSLSRRQNPTQRRAQLQARAPLCYTPLTLS